LILVTLILSIIFSAGCLAWGYAEAGANSYSIWIGSLGLLWLVSLRARLKWFSSFVLVAYTLIAMLGLWLNLTVGWMFGGAIFALLAWDMDEFQLKLNDMPAGEDLKGMARRHLARVSLLTMVGLLVATLLMSLRGQAPLGWKFFLSGVTVLGLSQIIGWLRG